MALGLLIVSMLLIVFVFGFVGFIYGLIGDHATVGGISFILMVVTAIMMVTTVMIIPRSMKVSVVKATHRSTVTLAQLKTQNTYLKGQLSQMKPNTKVYQQTQTKLIENQDRQLQITQHKLS